MRSLLAAGALLAWVGLTCLAVAEGVPVGPAAAAETSTAADVALHGEEGTLVGQVVDQEGKAVAAASVQLRYQNKVVGRTSTDRDGRFAFGHLRGGVYQATAAGGYATYRAWVEGTAPRSAKPAALLVAGGGPVRGQKEPAGRRLRRFLTHPVVVGAGIATAVAVPLALANSGGSSDVDAGVDGTVHGDPTVPEDPISDPAS